MARLSYRLRTARDFGRRGCCQRIPARGQMHRNSGKICLAGVSRSPLKPVICWSMAHDHTRPLAMGQGVVVGKHARIRNGKT